jgi:hypothetical protein
MKVYEPELLRSDFESGSTKKPTDFEVQTIESPTTDRGNGGSFTIETLSVDTPLSD